MNMLSRIKKRTRFPKKKGKALFSLYYFKASAKTVTYIFNITNFTYF